MSLVVSLTTLMFLSWGADCSGDSVSGKGSNFYYPTKCEARSITAECRNCTSRKL